MKATVLLNYNESTRKVEEEERTRFLRNVLEQMGIPVNEFWSEESVNLTVSQKIKLRQILSTYSVQVLDDVDGNLQIFMDNEKIASWEKPLYKLKKDLREIDPRKKLYLEMLIDCWTIFDDSTEET